MPDREPTSAMETSLLLQTPPGVASAKGTVSPTHTLGVPVIGATANDWIKEAKIMARERISGFIMFILEQVNKKIQTKKSSGAKNFSGPLGWGASWRFTEW